VPADLQVLAREYAQKLMFSGWELSTYLCAFRKIMQPLLNEDCIGKAERDHIFMEGIPSEAQAPIRMHLMIKHPDHYPQDPYPYTQVYDAGQFILPANAPPPTSALNTQDAIPTLTPPAPFACEQTPMPGTVIKHEYRREVSSFNDCAFCGSIEHFFARCLEKQRYIDAGKCKVHEETLSYPIHSRFSSEVPDVRSDQIRSTDPYRIRHDKLLHSYPVHITLNTAYFLHLVYPPFRFIGYAFFRLCSTDPFHL